MKQLLHMIIVVMIVSSAPVSVFAGMGDGSKSVVDETKFVIHSEQQARAYFCPIMVGSDLLTNLAKAIIMGKTHIELYAANNPMLMFCHKAEVILRPDDKIYLKTLIDGEILVMIGCRLLSQVERPGFCLTSFNYGW